MAQYISNKISLNYKQKHTLFNEDVPNKIQYIFFGIF